MTKGNVLVVDNEQNMCRVIGAELARNGYNVAISHNGNEAVDMIKEANFNVVLLDIATDDDSFFILSQIKKHQKKLPVIALTTDDDDETLYQIKNFGASACIGKPFDLNNLVELVSETFHCGENCNSEKISDTFAILSKGQMVSIEITNLKKPVFYSSSIYGKDEYSVFLNAPKYTDGKVINIPDNTSLRIGFCGNDAFYSFASFVSGFQSFPEEVISVNKPGVIYRMQRRQHPRIPLDLSAVCTKISDDSDEDIFTGEAQIVDISEGGMCLAISEEAIVGDFISVDVKLPSQKQELNTVVYVVRSKHAEEDEKHKYLLGCRFSHIDDETYKALAGCC